MLFRCQKTKTRVTEQSLMDLQKVPLNAWFCFSRLWLLGDFLLQGTIDQTSHSHISNQSYRLLCLKSAPLVTPILNCLQLFTKILCFSDVPCFSDAMHVAALQWFFACNIFSLQVKFSARMARDIFSHYTPSWYRYLSSKLNLTGFWLGGDRLEACYNAIMWSY